MTDQRPTQRTNSAGHLSWRRRRDEQQALAAAVGPLAVAAAVLDRGRVLLALLNPVALHLDHHLHVVLVEGAEAWQATALEHHDLSATISLPS